MLILFYLYSRKCLGCFRQRNFCYSPAPFFPCDLSFLGQLLKKKGNILKNIHPRTTECCSALKDRHISASLQSIHINGRDCYSIAKHKSEHMHLKFLLICIHICIIFTSGNTTCRGRRERRKKDCCQSQLKKEISSCIQSLISKNMLKLQLIQLLFQYFSYCYFSIL